MKSHYFNQEKSDDSDMFLDLARHQGYVPDSCLLNGKIVMANISRGMDPCAGCEGPRDRCLGRPYNDRKLTIINNKKIMEDG